MGKNNGRWPQNHKHEFLQYQQKPKHYQKADVQGCLVVFLVMALTACAVAAKIY